MGDSESGVKTEQSNFPYREEYSPKTTARFENSLEACAASRSDMHARAAVLVVCPVLNMRSHVVAMSCSDASTMARAPLSDNIGIAYVLAVAVTSDTTDLCGSSKRYDTFASSAPSCTNADGGLTGAVWLVARMK